MTTETTCLTSIWADRRRYEGLALPHARPSGSDYQELNPGRGCLLRRLRRGGPLRPVEPMIALPFHPSNAYTIDELQENLTDILPRGGEGRASRSARAGLHFTLHG